MPDSYWGKLVEAAKKAMETKMKWGVGFHGDEKMSWDPAHPNSRANEVYESTKPQLNPEWLPQSTVHDNAQEAEHKSQHLTLPQAIEVERDENPKIEISESEPPPDILKKIREYNARMRASE